MGRIAAVRSSPVPSISETLFATVALILWLADFKVSAVVIATGTIALWWTRGMISNHEHTHPAMRDERACGRLIAIRTGIWLVTFGIIAGSFLMRKSRVETVEDLLGPEPKRKLTR